MESTTTYRAPQDLLTDADLHTEVVYAGFWLRVVAFLIDIFVLLIIQVIVQFIELFGHETVSSERLDLDGLIIISIYSIYFPLAESSFWQGTLGKKALSMKVTTLKGGKISFIKAVGRFLTRILSLFVLLGTGLVMAAFTKKKQALHDITSSTLVVMN